MTDAVPSKVRHASLQTKAEYFYDHYFTEINLMLIALYRMEEPNAYLAAVQIAEIGGLLLRTSKGNMKDANYLRREGHDMLDVALDALAQVPNGEGVPYWQPVFDYQQALKEVGLIESDKTHGTPGRTMAA